MNAFAIINIAKKQLRIEEDDYRAMLTRVTGKDSLRSMNDVERLKIITEMERMGFKKQHKSPKQNFKKSGKKYVRMIFALWTSCHKRGKIKDGSRKALRAFVEKQSGVSDPEFLTWDQASPIIEALKAMEARR